MGGTSRAGRRASVRVSGPLEFQGCPRAHTRQLLSLIPRAAIAVMLGAALRRCAAAAATRGSPRGLLHPHSAPGPAGGKAPVCHHLRPRVLAVTWAPSTRGQASPAAYPLPCGRADEPGDRRLLSTAPSCGDLEGVSRGLPPRDFLVRATRTGQVWTCRGPQGGGAARPPRPLDPFGPRAGTARRRSLQPPDWKCPPPACSASAKVTLSCRAPRSA